MMVGELDSSKLSESYENVGDYFKLENLYNTAIFVCFVFMMCIIILSLFEGIAVGEIKDVLEKAHIEIIAAKIFYILKVQSILYNLYRLFNKNKEPSFMNIYEHKLDDRRKIARMNLAIKKMKKNRNVAKKIENDLVSLASNFNSLSRQISELTEQVRYVKKILE